MVLQAGTRLPKALNCLEACGSRVEFEDGGVWVWAGVSGFMAVLFCFIL